MAEVKVCLTVLVAFVILRPASSQSLGLGEGNCLISRIDVIPCEIPPRALMRGTTRTPGPNQYGIYVTRYLSGAAGFPVCRILRRDHMIRDVEAIGSTNKVLVLFSPGFTLDQTYGNSQFVDYNIQCGPGRLAFFNITKIDLENKICSDPNNNNEMMCVDYVIIPRGGFGNTESCGNDTSSNTNQLEQGNVRIIFRTNMVNDFPGFEATVICFDPGQENSEGCTRPLGANMTEEATTPGDQKRRRKRDLENFHKQWQRRAEYIKRMRRQAVGGARNSLRILERNVGHGMNVTYRNKKLEFIDGSSNVTLTDMTVENIVILTTFDANGEVDVFKGEAAERGVVIPLPGPGPMFIVGRYAYFQLFVIDPRGLLPTPEEMVVLANLTEAQLNFAQENETERLSEEFLNPPTENLEDIGFPLFQRRKKRQATPASFTNQAVLVALENENACNPVLRASANSIIEETDRADSDRLKALRALSTTATPTVSGSTPPIM